MTMTPKLASFLRGAAAHCVANLAARNLPLSRGVVASGIAKVLVEVADVELPGVDQHQAERAMLAIADGFADEAVELWDMGVR
jgi:hypothetical protein